MNQESLLFIVSDEDIEKFPAVPDLGFCFCEPSNPPFLIADKLISNIISLLRR